MERTVLVVMPVQESHKEKLEKAGRGCRFLYIPAKELTKEAIEQADIIVGNPPVSLLAYAKRLVFLQLESAGSDTYTKPGVLKPDILLANATGAYGLAISECMLAGVLSLFKKLPLYAQNQRQKVWKSMGEVKSIYQSVVLVLGLGDIGGAFAQKAKALGAYTIGVRRRGSKKPEYLDELHFMEELDSLLPRADIVALSLPQTPDTIHIMHDKRIQMMKRDAVLVNVGRGSAIEPDGLLRALTEKRLLGAVLDVTEPEPLPTDSPLWEMENVILTPHATGGYQLPETLERVVMISAANLQAFLQGEEIRNQVDFETGYRKLSE